MPMGVLSWGDNGALILGTRRARGLPIKARITHTSMKRCSVGAGENGAAVIAISCPEPHLKKADLAYFHRRKQRNAHSIKEYGFGQPLRILCHSN